MPERFNCMLRQRVSRLVRVTLSFAKKLRNPIGAIKSFIFDDNLTKCAAFPEEHYSLRILLWYTVQDRRT
jgi:hypothetical protein